MELRNVHTSMLRCHRLVLLICIGLGVFCVYLASEGNWQPEDKTAIIYPNIQHRTQRTKNRISTRKILQREREGRNLSPHSIKDVTADKPISQTVKISFENSRRGRWRRTDANKLLLPKSNAKRYCGITYDPKMNILTKPQFKGLETVKNPCRYKPDRLGFECFPYLFLIGAPKCGTTELYYHLTLHPEFVKPKIKEPHWLSKSRFYKNISYELYLTDYLSGASSVIYKDFLPHRNRTSGQYASKLITGDASATYMHDNDFWSLLPGNENAEEPVYTNPDYIHHLNPASKIILTLRNPIDRLWSDYLYQSREKNKTADLFHQIVLRAIDTYRSCFRNRTVRSCIYDRKLYLNSAMQPGEIIYTIRGSSNCKILPRANVHLRLGLYSVYLKDYLKVFPRQQIYVQRLEDYSADVVKGSNNVFRFLGMREMRGAQLSSINTTRISNKRSKKNEAFGDLMEETRHALFKFYKPFNEELANILQDQAYNYGLH